MGEPHDTVNDGTGEAVNLQRVSLMSYTEELALEVWIEPDSEPIAGSVAQPGGKRQPFGGWVELTAAIEAARRELSDTVRSSQARA